MIRKAFTAVLLLGLGGCNFYYNEVPSPDDLMHVIPWFDHMILSKAVHPYQHADIPRRTPAGVVPVGGGEADWQLGNPSDPGFPVYWFDTVYAKTVMHPTTPPGPEARSGEELFQIYCTPCHGSSGDGAGKVSIGALSLLTEKARKLSDGYLYSMIRYGRGNMPRYGDKIVRRDERWLVVDYVRELQRKSPVPPAPAEVKK